jgi:hypothetical protein
MRYFQSGSAIEIILSIFLSFLCRRRQTFLLADTIFFHLSVTYPLSKKIFQLFWASINNLIFFTSKPLHETFSMFKKFSIFKQQWNERVTLWSNFYHCSSCFYLPTRQFLFDEFNFFKNERKQKNIRFIAVSSSSSSLTLWIWSDVHVFMNNNIIISFSVCVFCSSLI